jgi:hypothetical protein
VRDFDLKPLPANAHPWLPIIAAALVVALVSVVVEPQVRAADRQRPNRAQASGTQQTQGANKRRFTLRPFRGFGTWVDIYDTEEWRDPGAAVRKMAEEGVQTLFLETANYRIGRAMFRPGRVSRFIEEAHARRIKVVAWYLPDFKHLNRDFKRSEAAIRFRSENKHRFDAFALDIESTVVKDIDQRNRRMFRLTHRIKNMKGRGGMKLGAITPDPIGSRYWPDFPYTRVARRYDVIMPMGYFTYRTSGRKGVRRHVAAGINELRERVRRDGRIHYIGGLAGDATIREARAYRRVALAKQIMGGGLYDFSTTKPSQWKVIRPLRELARR